MKPILNDKLRDPDKAVAWFRSRVPLPDDVLKDLEDELAERAFWVGGITEARLVGDVYDAIDRALDKGTTMEDFKDEVADSLFEAWGGENSWRLETVFRTNVQQAYNAGRWQEMQEPAVKELRPYGRFDAVTDDSTTELCASLNGQVRPMDDWGDLVPPLHFNCRSTIVSVLTDEAEEGELATGRLPDAEKGFGGAPDELPPDEPDLSGLPEDLASELRSRARG